MAEKEPLTPAGHVTAIDETLRLLSTDETFPEPVLRAAIAFAELQASAGTLKVLVEIAAALKDIRDGLRQAGY